MQQLKITLLATNIIPVHFKMLTNLTKLKTLKCYARRFERVYSTNIKYQAITGKIHFTVHPGLSQLKQLSANGLIRTNIQLVNI